MTVTSAGTVKMSDSFLGAGEGVKLDEDIGAKVTGFWGTGERAEVIGGSSTKGSSGSSGALISTSIGSVMGEGRVGAPEQLE